MPATEEQDKQIERLNWLVAIRQISREINSTIGLGQCLKTILDKTTELLSVDMVSIMLIDKVKNELSIRYAKGLNEKIIKEAKSILDQEDPREVAAWVAQRGEPLLIDDIEKDGRFLKRNGKKYSNNSLLSVPLKIKEEVIGVLNVNNRKDKAVFTQKDLDILMILAEEAAIAINNNRLYEELMSANERLQDLDRLKSDFVANVSHELSTPLATSRYLLSVIDKGIAGEINLKQREYLGLVENNIDRLTRLIENLLNLSRIEAGRFELKKEQVELGDLIKEALAQFKAQAKSKTIGLKTALAPGIPKVYLDKDKVVQVFVNLLDNAMKFTKEGGRIAVSAEAVPDFVKVCVSDTGAGIAKEDMDKLFSKFQRVPQKLDSVKVKGTGLGLAITKEIIEAHRGRIWVESEQDKGSKFFFTLPVYNEEFFFKEYLANQLKKAAENKTKVSLIALDLAGLKELRKELSPEQMDSVISSIYKIAKNDLYRPGDLAMELKGQGRILVVAEADRPGAAILVERVIRDIKLHKIKDKSGKRLSVAVRTIALTFPDDGASADELFDRLNNVMGA